MYWGAGTLNDLYLRTLAEQWARENKVVFTPVLSQAKQQDEWQGRKGHVHEAVIADHPMLQDFDVYMAGPPEMIVAATAAFTHRGLPREQLFSDAFEYSQD